MAEIDQMRQELNFLKAAAAAEPFRVVELALEVATERMKVVDALSARDAAVHRLSEAYISLRQKIAIIERLQQDPYTPVPTQEDIDSLQADVSALEATIKTLREEIRVLKESPPPKYEEPMLKNLNLHNYDLPVPGLLSLRLPHDTPPVPSRCPSQTSISSVTTENHSIRPSLNRETSDMEFAITRSVSQFTQSALDAEDIIEQRNKFLGTLPIPVEAPDDTLRPIVLPSSMTLHDFLGNTCSSLRASLANYRVLQQLTTSWCPEREEHGYTLAPVFKCSTNPRVATAHRWTITDVMARINKPTECFFNKDGTWYYAGVYQAFRLDDLTVKEWEALSNETIQALIKETLAGRKNISPQNIYETSQLYAAGALKVACVALQCVGFNRVLYESILERAESAYPKGGAGAGLGSGSAWNSVAGVQAVTEAMAVLGMASKEENTRTS